MMLALYADLKRLHSIRSVLNSFDQNRTHRYGVGHLVAIQKNSEKFYIPIV